MKDESLKEQEQSVKAINKRESLINISNSKINHNFLKRNGNI